MCSPVSFQENSDERPDVVVHKLQYGRTRLVTGLTRETFQLYSKTLDDFRAYWHDWTSPFYVDSKMVEYIERMAMGKQKYMAERLVASLNHFRPDLARQLPLMRRYISQLRRQHRTVSKPPMIRDVVVAMALDLCQHDMAVTAIGLLLQFDCYLRPSELCNVRVRHFVMPKGNPCGKSAINKAAAPIWR